MQQLVEKGQRDCPLFLIGSKLVNFSSHVVTGPAGGLD